MTRVMVAEEGDGWAAGLEGVEGAGDRAATAARGSDLLEAIATATRDLHAEQERLEHAKRALKESDEYIDAAMAREAVKKATQRLDQLLTRARWLYAPQLPGLEGEA
jgi:hypothetical protein